MDGFDEEAPGQLPARWNGGRTAYACADGKTVLVHSRAFRPATEREEKNFRFTERSTRTHTFARNAVSYGPRSALTVSVSGTAFSRDMSRIASERNKVCKAKTVVFPRTVRAVDARVFICSPLRAAVLNEGLEALGGCENDRTRHHGGPFYLTLLRKVALPSTLRVLGNRTFSNCELLERVEFRGESSLARIGCYCFANTLLEEIELPSTLWEMEEDELGECPRLRTVWVGDGFALTWRDT